MIGDVGVCENVQAVGVSHGEREQNSQKVSESREKMKMKMQMEI